MGACNSCVDIERHVSHASSAPPVDSIVVYAATWCHWSQKLVREWNEHKVSHTVVWCDLQPQDCPSLTAFPTIELPGGTRAVGYHSPAWVQTHATYLKASV